MEKQDDMFEGSIKRTPRATQTREKAAARKRVRARFKRGILKAKILGGKVGGDALKTIKSQHRRYGRMRMARQEEQEVEEKVGDVVVRRGGVMTEEIKQRYDRDGDGSIDFEEMERIRLDAALEAQKKHEEEEARRIEHSYDPIAGMGNQEISGLDDLGLDL